MRTQAELDELLLSYRGPQRPLWPLPYVARPTLRVMLPDGSQATLPGDDWANLTAWMISADSSRPPAVTFRTLTRKDVNPTSRAGTTSGRTVGPTAIRRSGCSSSTS